MNQSIDLYDQRQQSASQAQAGIGQSNCYGQLGLGYYIQQIPASRPMVRELTINVISASKVFLDYGEDIRHLMAEPVKGMKLREAIQLLKESLCNLDPHQ
jgi:hypothetical protein